MEQYFISHGTPVSAAEIEHFIQENGLVLPKEYKDFIKKVNGGKTEKVSFELANFDSEKKQLDRYIDIEVFFSLTELNKVWNYVKDELNEYGLFPIADVKGGMIICCKQQSADLAKIYFYETISGATKLTESLQFFFELLISESEVDYKKYGMDY